MLYNHTTMKQTRDVIFINSHPIQYFAPLYKYMNEQGVKTKCWYCSDESLGVAEDKEFGVKIKWDVPLLDGYEAVFFKNYSWKPSHFSGFFGLMNLGMIVSLFRIKKSVIIVHGWHYFSHFLILLLGGLKGHTICVRCDIPLKQEKLKSGWKQKLKYFVYKHFLFSRISKFLYVGEQNRLFYKSYEIADKKLLFCPYAVDNDRFQASYEMLKPNRDNLRGSLGIGVSSKVIVFSGKYIEKKKPLDILKAFKELNRVDCWLVMVGEGRLRSDMENFINEFSLSNVILTGFVNQVQIAEYYMMADVFVMCSELGENWGLSVNEAMNFNTPILLSDLTGSAEDLVIAGANGFVFETGNTEQLKEYLEKILYNNTLTHEPSSLHIVDQYSFWNDTKHIQSLV